MSSNLLERSKADVWDVPVPHRLEGLDRIARIAATALEAPAGVVLLQQADRMDVTRGIGQPERLRCATFDVPRQACEAVLSGNRPMTVQRDDSGAVEALGGTPWVALAGVPLRGRSGDAIGSLCVLDDLPRSWTHEELSILEDLAGAATAALRATPSTADPSKAEGPTRMSAVLDRITDLVYAVDGEQRVTFANRHAVAHFGRTRDELLGRSLEEISPGYSGSVFERHFRHAATTGLPTSFTARSVLDPERWFQVHVHPADDGLSIYARDVTNEHRARLAARESDRFTRTVIENLGEGVFVCDRELVIRIWNGAMEERSGLAALEVVGRPLAEILPTVENMDPLEHARRALRGESIRIDAAPYEYSRTGRTGWSQVTLTPHRSADREIIGLIGVVRDITNEQRAEKALRESENRFRTLLEHAADGIMLHTPDGRFVDANQRACEMLGYTRQEVLGLHLSDVEVGRSERDPEEIAKIRRGDPITVYGLQRRKDGTVFPVEVSVGGIELGGESLRLALIRDITERRRAEERIRFQAKILDEVGEVVLATDLKGRIQYWNRAAEELLGWRREAVIGQPAAEILPPDRSSTRIDALLDTVTRGERWAGELSTAIRSGGAIPTQVSVSPLHDSGDDIVGMVAVATDISERVALEAQLRQMQKMEAIGQLAGGVAHDFNNVLTSITGYADLALDGLPEDHPLRAELDQIKRAAGRAAGLTRQLLAFSRKQVLQSRVLSLNDVVRDLGGMLERLIGEHIALRTELAADVGGIRADPAQLEQVLLNLVVNARDAVTAGGTIEIRTGLITMGDEEARARSLEAGPYVVLGVRDDGTGMDPETLSRIFEPFFTTKRKHEGTGLGLSTVYGIIMQSSGYIEVESEPGKGTAFRVYFPLAAERAEPQRKKSADTSEARQGGETILVAEDDDQVRSLVRRTLEKRGFSVIEAKDGREALDLYDARTAPIDLVLTDVVMPRLGGRALHDELRARDFRRILFMSGYTDDVVLRRDVIETDGPFLEKPFTPADLAAKVRDVLDAEDERDGDGD